MPEVPDLPGRAGPADLSDLLLGTPRRHDRVPTGDEVVAPVAASDVDRVTGATEAGYLLSEDQLHRHAPQRAVEV